MNLIEFGIEYGVDYGPEFGIDYGPELGVSYGGPELGVSWGPSVREWGIPYTVIYMCLATIPVWIILWMAYLMSPSG